MTSRIPKSKATTMMTNRKLTGVAHRLTSLVTATSMVVSSLAGSLAPAYAQTIVDPKAPIEFRPGMTSSGNGTPTVNIVKPSKGGVSHNKFREYNIDTRGIILNNSGLGGTSVIGGAVAANPNLKAGKSAKIIVNEVTGSKRSNLNGVTEVFGAKADVIVANPNGVGCVGCGFINTGSATLTTGKPIIDYDLGTVGLETTSGGITISGAGVSAPAGLRPDSLRVIGKSVNLDGLVDARDRVDILAGSSRTDGQSGKSTAIAGTLPGAGVVSSAAGVVRAGSIDVLSSDIDTGVVLSGNLQALGSFDDKGAFVPGTLSVVSAGDLQLTAGEVAGNAELRAARALEIARDLSAMGQIAITATDVSLLGTAGVHAGRGLSIVAHQDIVSNATLKSGGTLTATAGGDATYSGLIASGGNLSLSATDKLTADRSTLIGPRIRLAGRDVKTGSTWIIPAEEATIDGTNIDLGVGTAFDVDSSLKLNALERLSVGAVIDTTKYPGLSLAFRDLTIRSGGALVVADQTIEVTDFSNAGVLLSSGQIAINAETLTNEATGIIKAGTLEVSTSGELTNLGEILSDSTLKLLAEGNLLNDGAIGAAGQLRLEALSYIANSAEAELVANRANLILDQDLINNGSILAFETSTINAGGSIKNGGSIRTNANLTLVAQDLINSGPDALIGSNGDLAITTAGGISNALGSIQSNGSFELVAGGALTNSGLIYGELAQMQALRVRNEADGKIHAANLSVTLTGGDLVNLGQVVSAGTLSLLNVGDVRNSGILQAGGLLRMEALSYSGIGQASALAAKNANLILKGNLANAGLIAVSGRLGIDARGALNNSASGEIIAQSIEAKIARNLTNLGKILSEQALGATVAGVITNRGELQANGDLNLTVGDFQNYGSVLGRTVEIDAEAGITNAGQLQGLASLTLDGGSLANEASGRIYVGGAGAVPAGVLTIRLDGNLANLGAIASANGLVIESGAVTNSRTITAAGDLRLDAVSYVGTSPAAILAALNAQIVVDGQLTNRGELAAVGLLALEVGGTLRNESGATISGGAIDAKVAGNLTNLGSIVSAQSLRAIVNGVLTNRGEIRAGAALILQAASLLNDGEDALIETAGDMAIKADGDVTNNLGEIKAVGTLSIEAGDQLTNASGRIESGGNMQLVAKTLLNTALAGTDGGVRDFYQLGELTIDYLYDKDRHIFDTDRETFINATQHEFSGQIQLRKAGVIFSGADMIIKTDVTDNEEGRILAVNDLSIETRLLINDAQVYQVDHFVNNWGRTYGDNWVQFTAPGGAGWGVYKWNVNALNDEYYDSLIDALPRREVTRTTFTPARFGDSGARYYESGPNGPGYYTTKTTKTEEIVFTAPGETNPSPFPGWGGFGGDNTKPREYFETPEGKLAFLSTLNLLVTTGDSPVSVRGSDDVSQSTANNNANLKMVENVVLADLVNLEALGIDPDNAPDVIVLTNREPDALGEGDYRLKERTKVGVADVLDGSVIKAGGTLISTAKGGNFVNRGTFDGNLVVIEGSTLDNGVGPVNGFDPNQLGLVDPSLPGNVVGGPGTNIGLNGGLTGSVDFVLDDVAAPPLDLGAFNDRNIYSVDGSNFGNLERFTGSAEAARLLGSARVDGNKLSFYSDPVAEAKALANAALKQTGTHLVVDASMSIEEQREQLYKNASEFAERTGARYGVALTEAQRAALDKPIVWHETRLVNGKPVLVPRLYLPSKDELLRGPRGAGLISADDLIVDLDGSLNNSGAIVAAGLASISASSIINQRMANLDDLSREFAAGRGDSGLISAGTLFMATDNDLMNLGGTIASAGDIDLRVGGSLVNETQRYDRTVDGFDLCLGQACGAKAVDYNIATIAAGRDLTVIADKDIINRGGELGSVTNMLLAAGRNVEFETLKDAYLTKDYHQRGFLSGSDIVEHKIVAADASAQSLVGDVSIFAGYGVCDSGLCSDGKAPGDVILNGAMVTAFGNLAVDATGKIEMGAVSKEVQNQYKEWGFKGLGWGTVKQKWNDIDTSVTRLSGYDVSLNAKGPITGTGVKISAVNDLLMKTDETIRLEAAQDALYFTEKGFYIGLTFPGSAGIDAALQGGDGREILSGLAGVNPLTATLARLANADNGLAAGFAAVDLVTGATSVFGGAAKAAGGGDALLSSDSFGRALSDRLNPLSQFTDENGDLSFKSFGLSLSFWKKDQRWSESQISELTAGGDIVMKAGLDVLLTQGTKVVAGGDVSIDAGRDIIMSALLDYARDKSSNFGLQISLGSIGFDYGKSEGYDEQLLNASIAAGGDVSLKSGRDTALLGGNIAGRNVSLDVGRDLTILSPQAKGWRDGFSVGLTIGWEPWSLGVRGSVEEGEKRWSSPSGIVAAQNVDIKVAEDTMLVGALLQATDGDINLDTGTLVSVDLKDTDEYTNVGGSIGLNGSGLTSIGFHYENRDKQGVTRTTLDAGGDLNLTIHDANGDGEFDTPEDQQAAQQFLAAINKDASKYQEVLKDSYTNLSGELNVQDLREFGENLQAIQNYNRAAKALVPAEIQAQGPRAIDVWRKAIMNGASPEAATVMARGEEFKALVGVLENYDRVTQQFGNAPDIPEDVRMLIAAGYAVYFDQAKQGQAYVQVACGTNGVCRVQVDQFLAKLKQDGVDIAKILEEQTGGALDYLLKEAREQDRREAEGMFRLMMQLCYGDPEAAAQLSRVYSAIGRDSFVELARQSNFYRPGAIAAAIEDYIATGDVENYRVAEAIARDMRISDVLSGPKALLNGAYQLTPISDAVALVEAANSGDIAGVFIAGAGFLPIGKAAKLLGKSVDSIQASLRAGGAEKREIADALAKGPYDPRRTRDDLQAVYGADEVLSSTIAAERMKNVKLAGKLHPVSGVPFDVRGFPIFDRYVEYDTRLPYDVFRSASYIQQMKLASMDLARQLDKNPQLRAKFSQPQIDAIVAGRSKIPGLTWHHHQDTGRMQLVDATKHQQTGHVGGEKGGKGY